MRNRPPLRVIGRMLSNVAVNRDTGCIESLYAVGSHGYSTIGWRGLNRRPFYQLGHRIAWFAAHGDIPDGMTVDHMWRNRRCINIDHLRLLTNAENAGDNGASRRTHCPTGHEYTEANIRRSPKGHRHCISCDHVRQAALRAA